MIAWKICNDLLPSVLSGGAAGGICERATTFRDGKTKSLNTGVVTFINYNKKVLQKVSQITFAHETGHNFGSQVSLLYCYTLVSFFCNLHLQILLWHIVI